MYFLETINGLSNENLTSAVLKYLLLNSSTFRSLFHRRLVSIFPTSRVPEFRNGLICVTEETTDKQGRIDLLVYADNCVLAIENKLWAQLQEGQPKRYVEHMQSRAGERYGDRDASRIIMIAPAQRGTEISKEIDAQEIRPICCLISWEDVLDDLAVVRREEKGSTSVVAEFLSEFVQASIRRFDSLNVPRELLVGSHVRIGNHYQWDLLYRLREFYSKSGKMGSGSHHAGFMFATDDNAEARHWLGFKDEHGICELEVHTARLQFSVTWPPGVTERGTSWCGGKRLIINIPDNMSKREHWRELLNPIENALRMAVGKLDEPAI